MKIERLKDFMDLTRIHFFFVWPLVFCSGLILSFQNYGSLSNWNIMRAAVIAFFGFEAGFVLNDYVDREHDKLDVDDVLTSYWRPFGVRPIPIESMSIDSVKIIFFLFAGIAASLILTLPYPHSLYILGIMLYSYTAEWFYQIKKRNQKFPIAQIIGRTDFALFPVAGYLYNGQFDSTILGYLLFVYPYTLAHLGLNDIVDSDNDRARGMATIPIMLGNRGNKIWVSLFSLIHVILLRVFLSNINNVYYKGMIIGVILLAISNLLMWKGDSPQQWIKALPFFHLSLLFYTLSIILPIISR
jgi:4-hydroxybenzoate polyprenyltransferase